MYAIHYVHCTAYSVRVEWYRNHAIKTPIKTPAKTRHARRVRNTNQMTSHSNYSELIINYHCEYSGSNCLATSDIIYRICVVLLYELSIYIYIYIWHKATLTLDNGIILRYLHWLNLIWSCSLNLSIFADDAFREKGVNV